MSRRMYRDKLLCSLIDRYERSQAFRSGKPSPRRPQLRITHSELKDAYYDETDYRKREQINAALVELEQQGIIEIKWTRFREGDDAERVFLQYEALDEAYRLARLQPREAKLDRLCGLLAPLKSHPWAWVRAWWQDKGQSLAARQAGRLNVDNPALYADLVKVLQHLPSCAEGEGMLKRNFSQHVLGDSKRFEQTVEAQLVKLLQQHSPEEYDTAEELLDSVGIIANPELTLIAGALTLRIGDRDVDVAAFPGGCGLSDESIRQCSITALPAGTILTIENLTTYHSLVSSFSREELRQVFCLYTGGFPRRFIQRLLRKISEHVAVSDRETRIFHWGDIDYGGIRIYEFLHRQFFSTLQPLLMDVATYKRYCEGGVTMTAEYAQRLQRLLQSDSFSDWHPVAQVMLKRGIRVEQEGVEMAEARDLLLSETEGTV